MSNQEFEELMDCVEYRFMRASFTVSLFDSIEEIEGKVLPSNEQGTIILAYYHDVKYYEHSDIALQDVDYFLVHKREEEEHLRYCDVIDAINTMEKEGEVNPTRHLFLEGLELISDPSSSTPMYRTRWGS
jgi:hypothetical protein